MWITTNYLIFNIICFCLWIYFSFTVSELSVARPVIWSLEVMCFHYFDKVICRSIWHFLHHADCPKNFSRQIPVSSLIKCEPIIECVEEGLSKLWTHLNQILVSFKQHWNLDLSHSYLILIAVSCNTGFDSRLLLLLLWEWRFIFFKY